MNGTVIDRGEHAFDFDDLLVKPVELLEGQPELLGRYRDRFGFVLVDEYQDTNHAQYRFLHLLATAHGNLMVVGDDDQSIYGWRGAEASNILDFEKHFPGAHVIKLEQNYRSTAIILNAANAVIRNNAVRRVKTLFSDKQHGELLESIVCADADTEAKFVCDEIERLRLEKKMTYSDFAVLYRSNIQARPLEEMFQMGDQKAAIFDAQMLFLKDPALVGRVSLHVYQRDLTAALACQSAIQEVAAALRRLDDAYLQARAVDVQDAGQRVLRKLTSQGVSALGLEQPAILAAHDLTPSQVQSFERDKVLGVCLAAGSANAHSVILARAMELSGTVTDARAIRARADEAAATLPDEFKPSELLGVDPDGHLRQTTVAAHVVGGKFLPLRLGATN